MAARCRAALTVFIALVLAGCGAERRDQAAARHIILISVDTLRSDRLPAYGYRGVATPNIDALRRDSILYERAYSHCPLTAPSHASVFTGQLPAEHGIRDNIGYSLASTSRTLAEILASEGYATGAAISAYVLRAGRGLERGFAFYDDDVERDPALPSAGMGAVQRNGAQTIAVADRWIATNAGKPFFFFLHLYEPHSPYDPPEPYASRYRPYDGEIAHTDELIGRFIEGLKARGIYDDALLVFFSDHGEGLNDHGEEEHGIFLYREALQVPLFIKLPKGERQGESVSDPVQLSDIFPTVLEAATLTNESPSLAHAESLMNFGSATRPPRRIYSETYFPRFHFGWSDLHSLVDSDHHYIQAPQAELFDLRADPAERTNVLADQRRVYASMRNAIAPLVKEAAAPAPISAEEAAKLAALGYLGSAPASSDDDLPDPKTKVETFREIRAAFKLMRSGQYLEALAFYERLLRENPRMLDLWDVRARILMRLGRLDEAVASAKEGFKLSPQSTHLALLIATLSLERGDLEQSEQHAALAVKDHPGEAHEVLARVALARGDVTRAEAEARAALAEGDDRVRSLMILARIARERRDFESALTSITQAAALSEKKKVDVIGLHFLRGDILARLGRSTEAEHAFREEMREFPEEPQAYANLIVLLVADGRTAEATQVIHDLEKAAPTPPAYAAISNTLKVVGDERGARFWAVRGLKKYPRDPALRKLAG